MNSSRPIENIIVCYCFGANISTLKTHVNLKEKFTRMGNLLLELKDVARPVFIFLDNHPSQINVYLFKWCKDRGIHIILFPPNCTHILQMCSKSILDQPY